MYVFMFLSLLLSLLCIFVYKRENESLVSSVPSNYDMIVRKPMSLVAGDPILCPSRLFVFCF